MTRSPHANYSGTKHWYQCFGGSNRHRNETVSYNHWKSGSRSTSSNCYNHGNDHADGSRYHIGNYALSAGNSHCLSCISTHLGCL